MTDPAIDPSLRRVVLIVALLNLSYFGVEFAVALAIGSVSLFADSIDFLEDTSVNLLIFFAMAWSATNRSRLGMALALILLVPGLAVLWTAWGKFLDPLAPAPLPCRWPAWVRSPSISAAPSCSPATAITRAA